MNSKDETLIPVNIKFFEQIDEYIIPINEILEKAQEIEKKIKNKKNIESKKSDNQIINLKNKLNLLIFFLKQIKFLKYQKVYLINVKSF